MRTPEARVAYLQLGCGSDVTLRRNVDELLKEHFSNDSLLGRAALDGERLRIAEFAAGEALEAPTTLDPTREAAPTINEPLGKIKYFGDYELLEEIARGGMGVVYKATITKSESALLDCSPRRGRAEQNGFLPVIQPKSSVHKASCLRILHGCVEPGLGIAPPSTRSSLRNI